MARKSGSSQARQSQGGRASSAAGKQGGVRKLNRANDPAYADPRVFDERTRRDIIGVAFIVVALALLVATLVPSEGIVSSFISDAMQLVFGIGGLFVPFFLAVMGVTFLIRFERERVPVRVAVGLALVMVALLGLIGVASPTTALDHSDLFAYSSLVSHGGYVGAGIAWAGLTLFGQAVTIVILIGVIIIGVIIIGFSLSKLIETIRGKREAVMAERADREARGEQGVSAPLLARIKRGKAPQVDLDAAGRVDADEDAEGDADRKIASAATSVLGKTTGPRRRRARSAQLDIEIPAVEGHAPTRTLGKASQPAEASKDDEAPKALTRKLGKTAHESTAKEPSLATSLPKSPERGRPRGKGSAAPAAALESKDGFTLPPMSLLASQDGKASGGATEAELKETAGLLQETLEDFGIMAEVVGWVAGPTVTLFKVDLPAGVRVSRITALNDDIALTLAAPGVRIFAPIPGTNYVGIEVPNRSRQTVLLGEVLADAKPGPLQIAIGKDVEGHSIVSDLAKMPHLLIGGTTGSGKSVSINAMIMSILMRATPSEVRFIMIDPKRVEFTPYNGIPHLYVPVVTEAKEASSALSWGVAEMERRLKVFSKVGARNIGQFNAKVQEAKAAEQRAVAAGEEPVHWEFDDELPYIVIIIDELADLMMNVGKEVEFSISRIAQLARAAGIHLIVATQRPSTNVVTGLIKANITNRIAFNVASGIDSRVILDTPGAENLIGLGDLLLSKPELAKPQRIQGCYVSEDEINAVVEMLKAQGEPEYHSEILKTNVITLGATSPDGSDGSGSSDDPLLWEAAEIVVTSGLGSTSNIQRRLKVGYSRAGRIMDQLEEKGIVGAANGSKPREVLVDEMELETLKAFEMNDADGDLPF